MSMQNIGNVIFELGISAGSGALAATLLKNPVGALGGAITGVTGTLVSRPVELVVGKIFNTTSPQASLISKVAAYAVGFFASAGVTMGVARLMNVNISFGSACALTGTTYGISIAIILPLACCAAFAMQASASRSSF